MAVPFVLPIVLLSLSTQTLSRYLDPPEPPTEFKGQWALWEKCPTDTFVHGISFQWNEEHLAAMRFHCATPGLNKTVGFYDLNVTNVVLSASEAEGSAAEGTAAEGTVLKWTDPFLCERGLATGIQLLVHNDSATASITSNVALICSDEGLLFDEHEGPSGIWTKVNRCNSREAICATQAEILNNGNVTSLQTLRFDCCEIAHPAETCVPSDTVEEIGECDNEHGALMPLSCAYNKKLGISYNNEREEERSIFEDLGFDLASAGPYLAAQPDFDPSQGKVTFAPETSSMETITAESGTKVTITQIVGTCGFYTIRTNFVKVKTYQVKVKAHQVKVKTHQVKGVGNEQKGFYDTEGMQGDSGWEDDDDWADSEDEAEVKSPEAVKEEPKTSEASATILKPQSSDEEDDWGHSEEQAEVTEAPKLPKIAETTNLNQYVKEYEADDWEDSAEAVDEAKTPEVLKHDSKPDETPNQDTKAAEPLSTNLYQPVAKEEADDWEDSAEAVDEAKTPEVFTHDSKTNEAPNQETKAPSLTPSSTNLDKPVTKDEADSWEDSADAVAEVIAPEVSKHGSKTDEAPNQEAKPAKPSATNLVQPVPHDEADDWEDSEEEVTTKSPEATPQDIKIHEADVKSPTASIEDEHDTWGDGDEKPVTLIGVAPEAESKSPKTAKIEAKTSDVAKDSAAEEDDWNDSEEKTENPEVLEATTQPKEESDKTEPEVEPLTPDTEQGRSLADFEELPSNLMSNDVELLKPISATEAPLENLRQASSEEAETYIETPIVGDIASPAHDQMVQDDGSVDEFDDFDDEEEEEPEAKSVTMQAEIQPQFKVAEPESSDNILLAAKVNADALGKRAFDYVQSITVPPLIDLSSLGDQISKGVSTFAVEGQKVIDEVKAAPIFQDGQKKVEETLKTVVEAAIGFKGPDGSKDGAAEVDGAVDSDYVAGGDAVEMSQEAESDVAIKKAGGFVGYIVGGMVVCVVIIVIVIFIVEKRGKISDSKRDTLNKEEYKADAVPAPEPLLTNPLHQTVKIDDYN